MIYNDFPTTGEPGPVYIFNFHFSKHKTPMGHTGWIESPYASPMLSTAATLRYASYCMSYLYLTTSPDSVYIAPHMCYGHLPEQVLSDLNTTPHTPKSLANATCWFPGKEPKAYRDFSPFRHKVDMVYFFEDIGFTDGMRISYKECMDRDVKVLQLGIPNFHRDLKAKKDRDAVDNEILGFLDFEETTIEKGLCFPIFLLNNQ